MVPGSDVSYGKELYEKETDLLDVLGDVDFLVPTPQSDGQSC